MSAEYKDIAERFAKETAGHEMTVLHDDGLYRHLRFKAPDTGCYWFDLITWPGTLAIRGDINQGFMFTRLTDMFEFFRGEGVNPGYWAEKTEGGVDSCRSYSKASFDAQVAKELGEAEQDYPGVAAAWFEKVNDWWLEYNTEYEHDARAVLQQFEYLPEGDDGEPFTFADTFEWNLHDWDWSYLWVCHAIVWGIAQYDAALKQLADAGAKAVV